MDTPNIGDHVFVDQRDEEVGAVRQVTDEHVVAFIENAGDFAISKSAIKRARYGKVVLDPEQLDPKVLQAIEHAHDRETENRDDEEDE